jgi:hypothetical protein
MTKDLHDDYHAACQLAWGLVAQWLALLVCRGCACFLAGRRAGRSRRRIALTTHHGSPIVSYSFDVLSGAWALLKQSLPQAQRDGEVAMRFGFLLEELHDANHRLHDVVNKDARVTADARRLEAACAKRIVGP